jgi:hypothetical protein
MTLPVIIIRDKNDPKSDKLSKITRDSWEKFGYVTEFFDAITPNDLEKYNYLDFGNELLPHKLEYISKQAIDLGLKLTEPSERYKPLKGSDGKFYNRVISDTAKSVYYSHVEVWKLISKRNCPHIVVDHDMVITNELPDMQLFEFYQFGEATVHCSYYTPYIINKILSVIENFSLSDPIRISENGEVSKLKNIDGYLTRILLHLIWKDPSLQNRLCFAIGSMVYKLNHIRKDRHSLFYDNERWSNSKYVLDVSKKENAVYATVHHEKFRVAKKVAVMVNGMIPKYISTDQIKDSVQRLRMKFQGCDIYWQTWDTPEQRKLVYEAVGDKIKVEFVKPPPKCSYNPYSLVNEEIDEKYWLGLIRFEQSGKKQKVHSHTSACNQQLSFWEQWKRIPKDYDYYVKTRWDIYFNDNLPLKELYALADDSVIGLSSPTRRSSNSKLSVSFRGIDARKNWDEWCKRVKKKRDIYKHYIDSPFYCVIGEDTLSEGGRTNHPIWNNFLSDMMIIFKKSDMEDIDVSKMYEEKKLYPCEFGWHQIFCNKRQHKNVDLLVAIKRNIISDEKFIKYCRRLGI